MANTLAVPAESKACPGSTTPAPSDAAVWSPAPAATGVPAGRPVAASPAPNGTASQGSRCSERSPIDTPPDVANRETGGIYWMRDLNEGRTRQEGGLFGIGAETRLGSTTSAINGAGGITCHT